MTENNTEREKTIKFRYIANPDKILQKWNMVNQSFLEYGKIDYFLGILCPVCIAEMEVEERVRGEYATIEKLILKLYHNGITQIEHLSEFTGLNAEMVENILSVLENGYGHIKDGVLTEDGLNSLESNINIQRYETTRQVQLEGLTGCVLVPELSQTMSGDNAYYDAGQPDSIIKYLPAESVLVNLKQDFADILNEYQDYEQGIFDRNIEMIKSIDIQGSINVECFLVKYSFLPHPFLLFPSQASRFIRWIPVAISASTKEVMDEYGIKFDRDVVVRSDSKMERIIEIYEEKATIDHKFITSTKADAYFEKENPETEEIEGYKIMSDYKNYTPVLRKGCLGKVEYCDKVQVDEK